MRVYLVRHGKAEQTGGDDRIRALTEAGTKAVKRIARALERAEIRVDRVEHSGLVRARQTAEILHETVGGELAAVPGLLYDSDVEPVAYRLRGRSNDSLMLVGHMPFMGRLASHLLVGDSERDLLHFKTSAIACLSSEGGPWLLEWHLNADVV
jgi:phosphohistidine phosphatase